MSPETCCGFRKDDNLARSQIANGSVDSIELSELGRSDDEVASQLVERHHLRVDE